MNETDWSRKICSQVPGTHKIENSIVGGTPDLCLPTSRGWLWTELKIDYGNKFLLKKTQHAAIVKEIREIPQPLHRVFLVIRADYTVFDFLAAEVLGLEKEKAPRGIWCSFPDWLSFMRLGDFYDKYGVYNKK